MQAWNNYQEIKEKREIEDIENMEKKVIVRNVLNFVEI